MHSCTLPIRFIETSKLSNCAYRVGTVLFSKEGRAISFRELEKITGRAPNTVAKGLRELEALGIIKRLRRSFREATSYTFLPETNWQL